MIFDDYAPLVPIIFVGIIAIPSMIFAAVVITGALACEIPQEKKIYRSDPLNPNNGSSLLDVLIHDIDNCSLDRIYQSISQSGLIGS